MAVQDFTSKLVGLRTSGRAQDIASHTAFLEIKHILDRMDDRASALETFQSNVLNQLAGAGVYVKYFYVQADLAVPVPEESAGSLLFYIFLMDSTGGWTVTLPTEFVGFYPDQIDGAADTISSIAVFRQSPTLFVPAVFGPSGVITT